MYLVSVIKLKKKHNVVISSLAGRPSLQILFQIHKNMKVLIKSLPVCCSSLFHLSILAVVLLDKSSRGKKESVNVITDVECVYITYKKRELNVGGHF